MREILHIFLREIIHIFLREIMHNVGTIVRFFYINIDMEHLIVRFKKLLPTRIERVGRRSPSFLIPKADRFRTLQFIKSQPENILRRGRNWEVMGKITFKGGGKNSYRTFLSQLKKVLMMTNHDLRKATFIQLQADPRVKSLYDRYFKKNPELITPDNVTNVVLKSTKL